MLEIVVVWIQYVEINNINFGPKIFDWKIISRKILKERTINESSRTK